MLRDVEKHNAAIAGTVLIRPNLTIQHGGGSEYANLSDNEVMTLPNHMHTYDKEPLHETLHYFPRECRWVTGAFFLITRDALEILGPLDEQYVHYKSDIEYCLRAKQNGMRVLCSSAICLHFHKHSSKQHSFWGYYWIGFKNSYQWYRCSNRLGHL
jgi:GT2 family glycosyltransferase